MRLPPMEWQKSRTASSSALVAMLPVSAELPPTRMLFTPNVFINATMSPLVPLKYQPWFTLS